MRKHDIFAHVIFTIEKITIAMVNKSLELYLNLLLYDQNLITSSSAIFGNHWLSSEIFGNHHKFSESVWNCLSDIWKTFGESLEIFRKCIHVETYLGKSSKVLFNVYIINKIIHGYFSTLSCLPRMGHLGNT